MKMPPRSASSRRRTSRARRSYVPQMLEMIATLEKKGFGLPR